MGSCAGTKDCSVVGCENGFCSDPTKQSLVIANTFCGSAGGCPAGQRKYDVWCAGSSGPAICSPEGGACLSDSACTNQSCELAEAGNNLCGGCTIPSRCCSPCRRMTGKTFCTDQYYPAGEYEPICGDTDPTCGGECTGGGGEPTPGGSPTPSPSPTPTPQPGAWWQVKDSDVQSTGDLLSNVPGGYYFGILGTGGFPGVPAYSGNTWLTGANVSETGWLVESTVTNAKTYSYDYFANQIPDDVAALETTVDVADVEASLTTGGTPDTNNYYWYKYDGALNGGTALTLPAVSFGTRKVILMVDSADVNITGNISLTVGQGFFMIVVKGNINVDPGVGGSGPNLEGLYFSDGIFSDGVGDTQLWIRGSVVANGGISMQRDLGLAADATTPSELFAYAPDQIMLFPKVLGVRRINWKEIAP